MLEHIFFRFFVRFIGSALNLQCITMTIKNAQFTYLSKLLFLLAVLTISSCKHEVPQPVVLLPDGGNGVGNGPGSGIPCDPDSIYFEQQILPILVSNCTQSGCHNVASAADGVVLTNYNNLINSNIVTPGNPGNSDLYEVLVETDPDKVMPPPGENPLSPSQISLIQTWIQQGAQNNYCDQGLGPCDTLNITFSGTVVPILQSKCTGCHSGGAPSGGINLTTWADVNSQAQSGKLTGSINHLPGFSPMPKSGPKLPNCEIRKIELWVAQGAPNN